MNPQLLKLEEEFLKISTEFRPIAATSLGLSGQDDQYADYSSARIRQFLSELEQIETQLNSLKESCSLDQEDQIDFQLLQNKIVLEQKELNHFCSHLRNPSLYVQEVLYGLWMLLVRPFQKNERLKYFLSRLKKIPDLFSQAKTLLENPPKIWTKIALAETTGLLIFLKDCEKELLKNYPREKLEISKSIESAIRETKKFQSYLKNDLLKRSNGSFAVGKEDFNFLLKSFHGFSENADEILKLGEKVLRETKKDLQTQANQIRKGVSWEKVVEEVRNHHPSQKNILKTYRTQTKRIRKYLIENEIVKIPSKEKLKIIETPLFARSTVPFAAYIDPPLFAEDRTGTFFVTPSRGSTKKEIQEYLKEHSYASLSITALHEGYPGHHLQFIYQANLTRPIRKIFNCSSYYEGWALYCEEMMAENGFYDGPTRLLQLKDKLWRACRILVDVGIQTGSMTDDEAVRFLSHEAKMVKAGARADVNWYSQSPTVPQSYLTGMLKIKSLREEAKKKWGKDFSLQKFHEWFLGFGAIPIPMIERSLNQRLMNQF